MTGDDHLRLAACGMGRCAVLMTIAVTAAIGPVASKAADGPLPIDKAAEEAFLQELGEGFRVTRSPRFSTLYHDAHEASARDIALRLDPAVPPVERFCEAYDLAMNPITHRLEMVYSDNPGTLERLNLGALQDFSGVYDRASKRCYFGFSVPPVPLLWDAQLWSDCGSWAWCTRASPSFP